MRLDTVLRDRPNLRRHHHKPAGRQSACEVHQARLIDAEFVHAVHHHDSRRWSDAQRRVRASRNGASLEFERFVTRFNRVNAVTCNPALGIGIANTRKQ